MIKAIIAFALTDMCLSLINTQIPVLTGRRHRRASIKRWENQTVLQRFTYCFFPMLFGFIVIMLVVSYKSAHEPNYIEQVLESGQPYVLVTDLDEIGDADIVYEIREDNDQNKICQIISSICSDLEKGNGTVRVYFENEEFTIKDNRVTIGTVTVSDNKYGKLLSFYWEDNELSLGG